MQKLVFYAAMTGILYGVDAFYFHDRYRTAAWQEVVYSGQMLDRIVEHRLAKSSAVILTAVGVANH